jgi:hypothetical protein
LTFALDRSIQYSYRDDPIRSKWIIAIREGGTMHRRSNRLRPAAAIVALVAILASGVPAAAAPDVEATPSQPSAIERLARQEDARRHELARYDAAARQRGAATLLDARERAMVSRVANLPTATAAEPRDAGFAWGAAALGMGAGIAGMCVLIGSATVLRGHGLRSA